MLPSREADRTPLGRLRRAVRTGRRTTAYAYAMRLTAGFSLRRAGAAHQDRPVLLVAPPANGNVGDQAMIEATLELFLPRRTRLIVEVDGIQVPPHLRSSTSIVSLPRYFRGPGPRRALAAIRLQQLIRQSSLVAVLGADMLDGTYDTRSALSRLNALRVARAMNRPAVVLGSSWSAAPVASCVRELARCSKAGVSIFARDPASLRRVAPVAQAQLLPDVVFAATRTEQSRLLQWVVDHPGSPVALYNASGLLNGELDVSQHVAAVRRLLAEGFRVALVPHVDRAIDSDLPPLTRIHETLRPEAGDRIHLQDSLLSPNQVRAVSEKAAICVTGRMHLGIICLSVGTPAAIWASQGKVEGLFEMLEAPELRVDNATDLPRAIDELITFDAGRLSSKVSRLRHQLVTRFTLL